MRIFTESDRAIATLANQVVEMHAVLLAVAADLETVASDAWASHNPDTQNALAHAAMVIKTAPEPKPDPWPSAACPASRNDYGSAVQL